MYTTTTTMISGNKFSIRLLVVAIWAACCTTNRPGFLVVESMDIFDIPPYPLYQHPNGASVDDVDEDNTRSVLLALGHFWSAEQTLEQYAPGVLEVVNGYTTDGTDDDPSKCLCN